MINISHQGGLVNLFVNSSSIIFMKPFFLICFCYLFIVGSGQDLKIEKDIVFGNVVDWKGQKQELTMDILSPQSEKNLPLVLFVHGGGFYGGNKNTHTPFCTKLANEGYVVANINYRVGFDTSAAQKIIGITMASYRAAQDASSALRYLVHHSKQYHIDTSAVFVSGESAGAITSLADAYFSQQEWDAMFPMLHQNLGTVRGSGNELLDDYRIRGVISLWGGVFDTTLINSNETRSIPIALIQSQSDEIIPFQHSKGQKAAFSSLYGSFDIAQRFQSSGSCARLYYTKEAKHFLGFSQHYIVNAIKHFIDDVQAGKCQALIEENKNERSDIPFSVYQ